MLSLCEEIDNSPPNVEFNGPIQEVDAKGKIHWYYYKDNKRLKGTKWIKSDGINKYYLRKGELVVGWLSYNDKAYFFNNQAIRVFNDIDPKSKIKIGKNGYIDGKIGKAYAYAIKRLDKYGWTLKKALRAARTIPFHEKQYRPNSVVSAVLYAKKNHCGNCYVRHAVFQTEAMLLGYKCRVIKGTVGASRAPHSWAEVKMGKNWYVFDATTYKPWTKGYKITYGQKGTYRYNRISNYLKFK